MTQPAPIPLGTNEFLTFASPLQVPPSCEDCVETWNWAVLFSDGTILFECQGPGTRHRSFTASVDTARVASIALIPNRDGQPVHQLRIKPGHRAIFFRRRPLPTSPDVAPERLAGAHCLGLERVMGHTVVVSQSYVFYFDDGHTIVSHNINPY